MKQALPITLIAAALGLAALPASAQSSRPRALFAPSETLHAAGTEPFWGAELRGGRMVLKTPDNERGRAVRVRRSEAPGRVVLTGTGHDGRFTMTVTRAACSDGMSDRTYPLTVRIKFPRHAMSGCGWTARRPFRGEG